MQIIASLTPAQAAKAAEKNPTVPAQGFTYTGEKPEFDFSFEDFIKWATGATIEVVDGDPSYMQKLMIEHAKFNLAERIRALLRQAEYYEDGNLTEEWKEKIDRFVANWKPMPGRQSALSTKSPEELQKEAEKARKKLEAIQAMLANMS